MEKLIIYTDGGSRNNPGPAAIAAVILICGANGQTGEKEYADFIGSATNNVAEYKAVIFALKKTKLLLGGEKSKETDLEIRSDSKLLVSQMNGLYKLKDEDLKPLFIEIWNLKQGFKSVSFILIPREKNKKADLLVNQQLNSLL